MYNNAIVGVAMGVQTSVGKVISIFVAVIAHKWVESFAAGVQLVRSSSTVRGAVSSPRPRGDSDSWLSAQPYILSLGEGRTPL